jgi:cytochrome c556
MTQNASPLENASAKHATEIILARRVLMTQIGRNMDALLRMTEPGGKFDATDAGEHADTISAMLSVFPYLFPPESNIWSKELEENEPATVSLAKPELWQNFDAFFERAQTAAQVALRAAYSKDEAEFRPRFAELQPQCDGCHAAFRRDEAAYVIPIPPKP